MSASFKAILKPIPSNDGRHLVMIRITLNRKVIYEGTGIHIKKSDWNEKANFDKGNWIRTTNEMYAVYNRAIKTKINELDTIALQNPNLSANALKSTISAKSESFTSYFLYFREMLKPTASLGRINHYQSTFNKLSTYAKGKDIFMSDLTPKFLEGFENYLLTINKRNTASKTLAYLKAVVSHLYKNRPDIAGAHPNPFHQIKLRYEKSQKTRLTMEEIALFESADLSPTDYAKNRDNAKNQKHHARNIFLLQYYFAGTRISDMLLAQKKHFVSGRFIYRTKKTDTPRSFKIADKALEILNEYLPFLENDNDFVFPFLPERAKNLLKLSEKNDIAAQRILDKLIESKTTIVSTHLKEIAAKLGINKNISTHVARHSFADQARRNKIDVYAISKALGHTRVAVTEGYLESFDTDAIDDVIDSVTNKVS